MPGQLRRTTRSPLEKSSKNVRLHINTKDFMSPMTFQIKDYLNPLIPRYRCFSFGSNRNRKWKQKEPIIFFTAVTLDLIPCQKVLVSYWLLVDSVFQTRIMLSPTPSARQLAPPTGEKVSV